MAGEHRNLTVVLSPAALRTLDEIWEWNASQYGVDHAGRYIEFVLARTNQLDTIHGVGRPVPTQPRMRYIIIRRRRKGHGHLAVYEVVGDEVRVLNYFHTAQDWQTKLAEELR
jgi:plasmid stabilization system protein ParE